MIMLLNLNTVKSLFRSKIMAVEGIRASNLASEGTIFTPPENTEFWFRESYGDWVYDCIAEECGRVTGTLTCEVYVRPDSGMRKADLLCSRITAAFDPFAGPFGNESVQIQPVSLRRIALSNDASWCSAGIRIEFAAWSNLR